MSKGEWGGGLLKRKQVLKLGSLNGAYFYLNFKRQDFSSGIDFQGIFQHSPHPPLAHLVKKENEATQRFLPSRYSMQACKRKKIAQKAFWLKRDVYTLHTKTC